MYQDNIRDLYKQKLESKTMILIDFLEIYIKLRIFFPQLIEERTALVNLVNLYFEADANEYEVLKAINKQYGKLDEHEGIDILLDDFDEMYDNLFEYCQDAFVDYSSFLEIYGDFIDLLMHKINVSMGKENNDLENRYTYRMKMRKLDFPVFDEKYKQKVLTMLPNLPDGGDDLDGKIEF